MLQNPMNSQPTPGERSPTLLERFETTLRTAATRRAYSRDLLDFFKDSLDPDGQPDESAVHEFVRLNEDGIRQRLQEYKDSLLDDSNTGQGGFSPATANRRLAAVYALLKYAQQEGLRENLGAGLVAQADVVKYSGIEFLTKQEMDALLQLPDTTTIAGLRDRAILGLGCENGLRRAEISALLIRDAQLEEREIWVPQYGRDEIRYAFRLSKSTAGVISQYLERAGHGADTTGPLFRSLDHRKHSFDRPIEVRDTRVTEQGLYQIMRRYAQLSGRPNLTSRLLRHSAIIAAIQAARRPEGRPPREVISYLSVETLGEYLPLVPKEAMSEAE